ncbi:MAG: general stress protein [Rhizobacter sp.]
MQTAQSPIHVFETHAQAEQAIQSLNKAGFDVKKLSLVGKGYHTEEHLLGFYTAGDRIKAWGRSGAFWGGIWGLLLAPAVFFIPGIGLVAMAGPVVSALIAALEGAVVVGGVSALGAALTQIGVPKEQVIRYETALKADKYVLMVHGNADDAMSARNLLAEARERPPGANRPWTR